jgi:luciferase family oxidoreductase group 1
VLTLSVLDQSPVRSGSTPAEALAETLALAEAVERLGYHRYWLAEHHSSSGLAGSSPEILIGQVAARTSRLRVGSGGVMLSHYSPLKVAENFRLLETLFPGRIDLGIGRAPGSDQLTARALTHGPGALGIEYFPNQISDLLGFVHNRLEPTHPFHGVRAMPVGETAPEIWLLGSSAESAALAAHFGTAFSFAQFINGRGGERVMEFFRRSFRPSDRQAAPVGSVGAFVICADTESEARRLAKSRQLFIARLYSGEPGPYPTVAEAEAHSFSPYELSVVSEAENRTVYGAPEQVRDRLVALTEQFGVREVVVVTITEDYASRLHSYELLADVFELAGASP